MVCLSASQGCIRPNLGLIRLWAVSASLVCCLRAMVVKKAKADPKVVDDLPHTPAKKKARLADLGSGVKDQVYTRFRAKEVSQHEEDTTQLLERMPLRDVLSLDVVASGDTLLLHKETREKATLPGGPWEFMTDDDGDPSMVVRCDVDNDTTDMRDIDVLLTRHLYRNQCTGERIVIHVDGDGRELRRYSLDDVMIKSRLGTAHLASGALPSESSLDVAVFVVPRHTNYRCFGSLAQIYNLLRLTTYKSQSSTWIWKSSPTWMRAFIDLYGHDQVVASTFETLCTARKAQLAPSEKCLPWPAVSTVGLLTLCSRWAFLNPAAGGLKDETSTAAAIGLLKNFISCASHTPLTFKVDLTMNAVPSPQSLLSKYYIKLFTCYLFPNQVNSIVVGKGVHLSV